MLPPTLKDNIRLFRVDNTPRQKYRPVEGLSGRWFSDDPNYIEEHYAHGDTHWTYVDVPSELAESFRYENLTQTDEGSHLYGVEGKDFILPPEWAEKRISIPRPDEYFTDSDLEPFTITEITSNVAIVGRVLYYSGSTGDVIVVEQVDGNEAVLLRKNRHKSKDSYERTVVPIRKVHRM